MLRERREPEGRRRSRREVEGRVNECMRSDKRRD